MILLILKAIEIFLMSVKKKMVYQLLYYYIRMIMELEEVSNLAKVELIF